MIRFFFFSTRAFFSIFVAETPFLCMFAVSWQYFSGVILCLCSISLVVLCLCIKGYLDNIQSTRDVMEIVAEY